MATEVYRITRLPAFRRDFGLVDQIRRAAVSVLANIAEGFERGGNAELVQFLYIAKGSCGELRAHITIAADQHYIDASTLEQLRGDSRRISAMLTNLIQHRRRSPLLDTKRRPLPPQPP